MPVYSPATAATPYVGYVNEFNTASAVTGIGSIETTVYTNTFTATSGQRYKVTCQIGIESTVAGDTLVVRLRQAYASTVAATDTSIRAANGLVMAAASTWQLYTLVAVFTATQSGTCSVGATLVRSGGTGTVTASGTSAEGTGHLLVELC